MSEQTSQYSQKAGLPPGSLVYVGEKKTAKVTISEIDFSSEKYEYTSINEINKANWESDKLVSWVDVNGVHNTGAIEEIGKQLQLDHLILEDIVNTQQRPKVEELDNYLFVVLKTSHVDEEENVDQEQVSLLLTSGGIVSFQESGSDYFKNIRERIINGKGTTLKRKSDYLFYRLIDTIIDDYFILIELFEDRMTNLEKKILDNPDEGVHHEIYEMKTKISLTKKGMVPIRETISGIIKSDTGLIDDDNQKYYRDVYDHVVQIIESIDSQREIINDFLNLYMSAMSNKMNEVMKVLTIFASIFIPLTFIAGIYGMNFDFMPELHWKYGYFITWGVMVAVAVILLNYFRRKKWL